MIIRKTLFPLSWVCISILVLAADYVSGPLVQFPIAFALPVILASWYSGRTWGVSLAVLLPIARFAFHHYWETPTQEHPQAINLIIRIVVLWSMAYFVDRTASLSREVKVLKGLLPICSFCKKIRTEEGSWSNLEGYISERSEAEFSHGLCPECLEKQYGDFLRKKK